MHHGGKRPGGDAGVGTGALARTYTAQRQTPQARSRRRHQGVRGGRGRGQG
jgi:hypothetical protein